MKMMCINLVFMQGTKELEYGKIVLCSNDECPIGWFHYECVHMNRKPKAKWLLKAKGKVIMSTL